MLKNKIIKLKNAQTIKLEQSIAEGSFATIYRTSIPGIVAKVSVKSNSKAYQAYLNETKILSDLKGKQNIIQLKDTLEISINGDGYCVLLIEYCQRGSLIDLLTKLPSHKPQEELVIMVIRDVAQAIKCCNEIGITHRDIKMENVLLGDDGTFRLCDFGSVTRKTWRGDLNELMRYEIQDDIDKNTTPMYRAPEQLDLYSGFPINEKVDMFALGVLMFVFCFQKPPFDTPLSAIRGQYFLPQSHQFSEGLINLIQLLFTLDPQLRPSADDLMVKIAEGWNLPPTYSEHNFQAERVPNLSLHLNTVDNMYLQQSQKPLGALKKIVRYINELTNKTEAWVDQATDDENLPPRYEDVRQIIIKAWIKKDKIHKFFEAVQSKLSITKVTLSQRQLVKFLIILHQYLKKGPPNVLDYDINNKQPNFGSILKQIQYKIINGPLKCDRLTDNRDTHLIQPLLKEYRDILQSKLRLCIQYRNIFEGNFSASPLLISLQNGSQWSPLTLDILNDLNLQYYLFNHWVSHLEQCNYFLRNIDVEVPSILNVKPVAMIQILDEVYSLICFKVHLICAIKQSTNYLNQEIDQEEFLKQFNTIQEKFEQQILSLISMNICNRILLDSSLGQGPLQFLSDKKINSIAQQCYYRNKKNKDVLETQWNISAGLCIPLSYSVTIKKIIRPNFISVTDYPIKQQPIKAVDFHADFSNSNAADLNDQWGFMNVNNQDVFNIQNTVNNPNQAVNDLNNPNQAFNDFNNPFSDLTIVKNVPIQTDNPQQSSTLNLDSELKHNILFPIDKSPQLTKEEMLSPQPIKVEVQDFNLLGSEIQTNQQNVNLLDAQDEQQLKSVIDTNVLNIHQQPQGDDEIGLIDFDNF